MKAMSGEVLNGLEPRAVWQHFDQIRSIPHCSGNEAQLASYISAYAKSRGLTYAKDIAGNLRVDIPATAGKENDAVVIIQNHLDMVCEKNSDSSHDFNKEPLGLSLQGDWLYAQGTTLGADNGIGVACALALIDSPQLVHGPLELLFTVEEEIGLIGAAKLTKDFLTGTKLINLDSEELGAIYIGCAGGSRITITLPVQWVSNQSFTRSVLIKVRGLMGGHSGLDIDKDRGNAIKILADMLSKITPAGDVGLSELHGGNKSNAIPREAHARLVFSNDEARSIAIDALKQAGKKWCASLAHNEPDLVIDILPSEDTISSVVPAGCWQKLVQLLGNIPHGVEAKSPAIPALVETSNNLAIVSVQGTKAVIEAMPRSSVAKKQDALVKRICDSAVKSGASAEIVESYPGWEPDRNSRLLALAQEAYVEVTKSQPEVKAVHAGLECGILGQKIDGLEMISIGPTIKGAHSPAERVHVPSVEKFWQVLTQLLELIK